jgi:hypothetical protein
MLLIWLGVGHTSTAYALYRDLMTYREPQSSRKEHYATRRTTLLPAPIPRRCGVLNRPGFRKRLVFPKIEPAHLDATPKRVCISQAVSRLFE